jgi:DNA-binding CsgD family transcriptional regulator
MTEDQEAESQRARERAAARARRMAKAAFSQSSFDLLASGYSPEQIAEVRKVSVRTIRREIDSAIARRKLDAPERYVHLQVARLTKALRFADAALERGDLKAVRALVTVVAAMDRYHGLRDPAGDRSSSSHPDALDLHSSAAPALPPLRLSHAGSPPEEAPAESPEVTVFGA